MRCIVLVLIVGGLCLGQRLPAPIGLPKPLLPGGVVIPLYPAGSPLLRAAKVSEAEVYNMSESVPERIASIVNIHNPSIEVHVVEKSNNTGAVIILAAGGGHNTLNVGMGGLDFVPYFFNYGVNTVILRYRLRKDSYDARVDAVNDALQAVRLVRSYAKEFNFDPNKIGILGFSAGAELSAPAAVEFLEFDRKNPGVSSRPDFAGLIYPGPTPFTRGRTAPEIPSNVPPAFIASPGSGDQVHAVWAMEYYSAMLMKGVPNIEMHLYGNGVHGGGMADREGIPFGTWQTRFIEWFRDLGFLEKAGVETKAARDVSEFVTNPPKIRGAR